MSESEYQHWNRNNTNSLLIKDEVGKSKKTTYKLPSNEIAYGKPLPKDSEGAKEGSPLSLDFLSLPHMEIPFIIPWHPPRPRLPEIE